METNATKDHCGGRVPPSLLIVNLLASGVMLALSVHRATGFGCAAHFYPATIPTMLQSALAVAIAAAGLRASRRQFMCLLISSAALGLLGFPALYAALQWPGGDDGGGLGWGFIVGGGCLVGFVIGLTTLVLGLISRRQERRAARGPVASVLDSAATGGESVASLASPLTANPGRRWRFRPVRWLLWGIIGTAGIYLAWLVAGPVSWTTTQSESYVGGIEIRTTALHQVCAFPPLYHYIDPKHARTLFVHGQEVLNTKTYKDIFPSPSGAYIAAQDWLYTKPLRVYAAATGTWTEVAVSDSPEEFPDHYYTYPFSFLRWEDDRNLLVEVTGMDWSKSRGQKYRQIWRVAADTGVRTRAE